MKTTTTFAHRIVLLCLASLLAAGAVSASNTYYVSTTGSHVSPFDTWLKAATNIEAATDIAVTGSLVRVATGTYHLSWQIGFPSAGALAMEGEGRDLTFVDGCGAHRCFLLRDTNHVIRDLTITNGNAGTGGGGAVQCNFGGLVQDCTICGSKANNGGGVYCVGTGDLLERCIIRGNVANAAGGVYCSSAGTLRNCLIVGNVASNSGGGVFCSAGGRLDNCTITGNSARFGNGVSTSGSTSGSGVFINCVIYLNGATNYDNYNTFVEYSHCCTYPEMAGVGNITNNPGFANVVSGDYHLSMYSPCINAGTNMDWMIGATDFDGNPRICNSRVDIGAFELPVTWPIIRAHPNPLDFGDVVVGESTQRTLIVENVGSNVLNGEVTCTNLPFLMVGGSPYIINEQTSVDVVFSFTPDVEGVASNTVRLSGGGGVSVLLVGTGIPEPFGILLPVVAGVFIARFFKRSCSAQFPLSGRNQRHRIYVHDHLTSS